MSEKAERLNRLLQFLGDAAGEGSAFAELLKALTARKNREYALAFARTGYGERLLLLPQCLRSTGECQALEDAAEYVCAGCGTCKIDTITRRARELGYGGVRVLKGGSALANSIEQLQPRAVLGVACELEGALGVLECERLGVPVQFIPLLRDGCADTDVDINEIFEVLEFRQP